MIAGCWAGVRWQNKSSNSEVVEMCAVEDFSVKLRQRTLWWFGHVKRAGGGVLGEVGDNGWWEGLGNSVLIEGYELIGSGGACAWHRIDGCGKQSLPVQPHPRRKNMDVKWKLLWWWCSTYVPFISFKELEKSHHYW